MVRDLFFTRLAVAAGRLWPGQRVLAAVLAVALVVCAVLAGLSAKAMFLTLRPATAWAVGPAIAAFLAFVVVLELCAASIMMGIRAVLRLSYDTGRHRVGSLLTMLALIVAAVALIDLARGPIAVLGIPPLAALAATLSGLAFWFDRTYRRPAYPRFRDFHGDVVGARRHFARASHDG